MSYVNDPRLKSLKKVLVSLAVLQTECAVHIEQQKEARDDYEGSLEHLRDAELYTQTINYETELQSAALWLE